MKKCSACGQEKSIVEFYKTKANKSGLSSWCKECSRNKGKLYYHNNTEKCNLKNKLYREAHPELMASYHKTYREDTAYVDKLREYGRRHYKDNKGKRSAYAAKYREEHPEKYKERARRYGATVQGRVLNRIRIIAYRAKKHGLSGWHTPDDIDDIFVEQLGKCVYCRTELYNSYAIDHIIPVSRAELSPTNYSYNLQLLCTRCNSSKSDKTHEEYIDYLRLKENYNGMDEGNRQTISTTN